MIKRKVWQQAVPLLLFLLFAAYVLLGNYPDMLYMAQERNEFFGTLHFFSEKMSEPFGLMSYLGCYLTQFFYYPALGVGLLLLVWAACYGITLRLLNVVNDKPLHPVQPWLALMPLACLLCSLTDVGYWIYILPMRGYWFSQSLAYLCLLLLLLAGRGLTSKWRIVWSVAGSLLLFPLMGWWIVLFPILMLEVPTDEGKGDWSLSSFARRGVCLSAILGVLLWNRTVYTHGNHFLAGLPYFTSNTVDSVRTSYPFLLLSLFLLLLFLPATWLKERAETKREKLSKGWMPWAIRGVSMLLIVGMTWMLSFRDYNYQAEMRMDRALMEDDWQTIIAEEQKAESPSRSMVCLANIALLNTGELGNRSFALGNSGVEINNPDSLNVNVMLMSAPLIYYNYGKVQYAVRWVMESAVNYGFSPYHLKCFVRAAQEAGDTRLVDRYMQLLKRTTFHGTWHPLPSTPIVQNLHKSFLDVLDSDNDDCERYLIENFSLARGSSSPLVKELNLFYSMIYRDPQYFWPAFHAYMLQLEGKELPLHYQEAYLVMQDNFPVQLPYQVDITPMTKQNYSSYGRELAQYTRQGLSKEQIGEAMKKSWGHTYWWYIMYGRMNY